MQVRQYVLTLPDELRRLAAFKPDVLTALARMFVEATFARYRARARREGIDDPQCGAVNFVQRFGSLNLHVHFHVVVLDGVFARPRARPGEGGGYRLGVGPPLPRRRHLAPAQGWRYGESLRTMRALPIACEPGVFPSKADFDAHLAAKAQGA